ncbi:MAG: ABC transporter permease [Bifidobacteriaceae bacterium]|jgi:oligopeptide transport system permease protein|nr:ABC transporter permease [Bifidobacteriaceae bacterium]
MLNYVLKRILQAIPVFIGSTLLIYALVFLMPGDPVRALFGDKPVSEATLTIIRTQYHLNEPFIIQYLYFLKGLFTFDLGVTFAGREIIDVIASVFPNTLMLGTLAFVFEVIIGVGLGIFVGLKRGSFADSFTMVSSLVLVSIPPLVLGYALQFLFGIQLKVLPVTVGTHMDFLHLLMPSFVLATVSIATIIRLTRASISDVRGADFVRTARAKGISEGLVIRRHIFRNSMIPVITYLGIDLVALFSGAILTEQIFNIQGVGNTLYKYILIGEAPAVVTIATLFLILYIVSNIVIDCLYAALDPRIRYGKEVA